MFDPTVARSSDPQNPDAVAGTTITLLGIAHLTGGKQGNDTLRGVDGADSLFGGGDRDLIVAGTGVALIDGGSGTDTVPLRDITCGVDDIGLLAGVFADINAATIAGRLTVNATGTVGASSVAHIDFDMSGAGFSRLFFDANGNGAGAAVPIASLTPTTGTLVALGSADFAFL